MKKIILFYFIFQLLSGYLFAQSHFVDLSGKWRFALDSMNVGEKQEWYKNELLGRIKLPGTTDEGKYGKKHIDGSELSEGESEIWRLARKNKYIGPAWYQKDIVVPDTWKNKKVYVELERCLWQTKLWVNDTYIGEKHSLCAPHKFEISSFITTGKNKISIRIDNSPFVHLGSWSHGYSPGIQTIWNGAIGDIKLIVKDPVYLDNIQVYTSHKNQTIEVKGVIFSQYQYVKGEIGFFVIGDNNEIILSKTKNLSLKNDSTPFYITIPIEKKLNTWDEFEPNLYMLKVESNFEGYIDESKIRFGVRDIETEGGQFVLNGNKIIMRGEHDAGSFPLTGYPSMEKNDWLKIFNTGKKYGLNHWRFHSWCPPKAAFDAADEVGIYLQPELTLFSQAFENTLIGTDPSRDEFLFEELKLLLDTYGNHPSFVLMCMGNELKGDYRILEKWVAWGKKHDPRHLFAGNSNLEAMGKYKRLKGDDFQVAHAGLYKGKRVARRMYPYFNNEVPNTQNDYSRTLQPPFDQWPIISHEIGQWTVYPDFSEIKKYKGVLAPRNFEVFKSRLEQKGMIEQADDFLMASGKLSSLLYKEEVERILRTPNIGGFQLLDIRDYQAQGSAMVGLLNAFWEPKGFIGSDKFRQSCNDITLLLKMSKRVWKNNEKFVGELVVPNYSYSDIAKMNVDWKVIVEGKRIISGRIYGNDIKQGKVSSLGKIVFDFEKIKEAQKIQIRLSSQEYELSNSYNIWVYPKNPQFSINKNIVIATQATDELLGKIKKGATVLLVPENEDYDAERTTFTTPFWSTILFNYQVKTMGLLCDPNHPVFANFPTDYHSDWQWWELMRDTYSARLNNTEESYKPLLQVIDHPVRNDKLGAIVETKLGKGKLLVCTFDILSGLENRLVAKQLKYSILKYMSSDKFNPPLVKGVKECFFTDRHHKVKYNYIQATNEDTEHPAFFAFDGSKKTFWQNLNSNDSIVSIALDFDKERYITGLELIAGEENCAEWNFDVYILDKNDKKGKSVISGMVKSENYEAISWDNGFSIQKGKKGKKVIIEFRNMSLSNKHLKLYELNWVFGD